MWLIYCWGKTKQSKLDFHLREIRHHHLMLLLSGQQIEILEREN